MARCTAYFEAPPGEAEMLCSLPGGHDGPHWDDVDRLVWRVVTSRAVPRITEAMLTPSADLPACRDEDLAQAAVLAAAYPDPPEYPHPEEPPDGV